MHGFDRVYGVTHPASRLLFRKAPRANDLIVICEPLDEADCRFIGEVAGAAKCWVRLTPKVLLDAGYATPQQRLATLADTLAQFTCHPFAHDAGTIEQSIAAEAAAAQCLPNADDVQGNCAMLRHASAQLM